MGELMKRQQSLALTVGKYLCENISHETGWHFGNTDAWVEDRSHFET